MKMKKIAVITVVYAALVFAISMGATFLYRAVPALNAGDENPYRFVRGLHWFLAALPAVLLSGFSVACSVAWRDVTGKARKRFSPEMFGRFKGVLLLSLLLVLILSLGHEVFEPGVAHRLRQMERAPDELADAKATARRLLAQGEADFAYQYALRAIAIAPQDADAARLAADIKDEVALAHEKERSDPSERPRTVEEQAMPLYAEDHAYTVSELLGKARVHAQEKDWFQAHYWARLAVDGCSGTDTNLPEALALANEAWNNLKNPEGFGTEAEFDFYTRKMKAYEALSANTTSDNLTAYYAFVALQQVPGHAKDPDILRFLALAQEAVENEYFFTDETQLMDQLENSHDIYFSLESPVDHSRHVFFIKGAMDTREDGHSVRYLDGLSIVTYSKEGRFLHSLYAPYAKVIAHPVSDLSETTAASLGVEKSWKSVPFLMLQAVDRETKGLVVSPTYSREETGLSGDILARAGLAPVVVPAAAGPSLSETDASALEKRRTILLPMSYSDFVAINTASAGPDRMDLLTLHSFMGRVTKYGFSFEVFNKSLVGRAVYPLFLLVLLIVAATAGWNYRIEGKKSLFKFRWIFLVPLYTAVIYLILQITTYFFDMLNYVLVGACGQAALLVSFLIFAVALLVASVNFLARHE